MKTLTQPHPENDNQAADTTVGHPPKSILPIDQRGINSIMVAINGRSDRHFYAPAVSSFWRPPADVEAAIFRGNKKVQASSP